MYRDSGPSLQARRHFGSLINNPKLWLLSTGARLGASNCAFKRPREKNNCSVKAFFDASFSQLSDCCSFPEKRRKRRHFFAAEAATLSTANDAARVQWPEHRSVRRRLIFRRRIAARNAVGFSHERQTLQNKAFYG